MRCFGNVLILFTVAGAALAAAEPRLMVSCGAERRELTATDLARLPVVETEALDHGAPHQYRGVAVRDVLALVGAPLVDDQLRGANLALAVRVRAADGYIAAFALAEFNAAFRATDILLVDQQDGQPLLDGAGPWRLVCPGDKRGARWARQVVELEVVSLIFAP